LVKLVNIIAAFEEGTAAEELSKNTTDRPNIDCVFGLEVAYINNYNYRDGRTGFGVALKAQHDFRGPIPSRSDIFSHVTGILFRVNGEASSQSKITDLELAVSVDK
jgi:hypothetical protein